MGFLLIYIKEKLFVIFSVIEAVDLDSLLAEFEATESVNINMEKSKMKSEAEDFSALVSGSSSSSKTKLAKRRILNSPSKEKALWMGKIMPNSFHEQNVVDGVDKTAKKLIERKNKIIHRKLVTRQKIKHSLTLELVENIRGKIFLYYCTFLTNSFTDSLTSALITHHYILYFLFVYLYLVRNIIFW